MRRHNFSKTTQGLWYCQRICCACLAHDCLRYTARPLEDSCLCRPIRLWRESRLSNTQRGPNRSTDGRFEAQPSRHRPGRRLFAEEIEPNSTVTMALPPDPVGILRYPRCPILVLHSLGAFAFYAGVGDKHPMGMGQMRADTS